MTRAKVNRLALASVEILGVLLLLIVGSASAARRQREDLGVIPTPQEVTWTDNAADASLRVDAQTKILLPARPTDGAKFAATNLQERLRAQTGLKLEIIHDPRPATAPQRIAIGSPKSDPRVAEMMQAYGLELTDAMAAEGYVLGIGAQGIVIGAESARGQLYGTATLRQMIVASGPTAPLPAVRVRDWPKMSLRGIHDEFSYGQVSTMENFKDMIRFLSDFKMNTLIFYFEDTFRFQRYPTIGEGRGALTRAQVDELEAFARPLGVEIFPVFEMLGNQGALLMLDEVRPFAEYPGAHSFSVDDEAFGFLKNCFQEMADAFDSKYFHAGLDESWDLGFGKSEALVKRVGRGPAHAAHYRRINDLLKSRGKTMIMYGDIILKYPEILDLIPKDIVLMDWQYEAADHYPTLDLLGSKGFPILVLPGMSNWDRIFPDMSKALVNIRNFTLECYRQPQPLGSITSTWGDNGSKNLRELLYYGYAYGAEVTWSPDSTDVSSFSDRFFTQWNGPGTAPYFEAIYALLEKWPWWYPMLDYFRHPFLPRKDERPHATLELFRVYEDARTAQKLCDLLEPLVVRRKGDVDYLRYCARMHAHYVASQRLVADLNAFETKGLANAAVSDAQARFLERIKTVRDETVRLRDTFEQLWLRTNQPANLHYAINEYNALVKVWDDAAARVQQKQFAYDPRPPAEWIYHPDAFGGAPVQHAYFRKVLQLDPGTIASAGIQVQGDTHVKIYVNGTEVGEQFARRNLSAPVNPKLLVVYDIKPHLRQGENVIALDARAYGTLSAELEPGGPERSGGFHLYGEIRDTAGKVQPLTSDASWKTSNNEAPGWNGPGYDDRAWRAAQGDPKPTVWVTYPDFAKGLRGFSEIR
ncbi:MAG: glycoside hydrolase family 20 zincin-like fold domain-containing protein [Pirellulales bacterium]